MHAGPLPSMQLESQLFSRTWYKGTRSCQYAAIHCERGLRLKHATLARLVRWQGARSEIYRA